jgi:hypothetical protein
VGPSFASLIMYLSDPGLNVCIVILHDLQEDMLDLFMI